ncbi:hypothetical protein XENTR_v10012346 [Xenopus tropicalis]|nr:hypothetical protein XENTR_v10012346 [Xenopus tropicalis]
MVHYDVYKKWIKNDLRVPCFIVKKAKKNREEKEWQTDRHRGERSFHFIAWMNLANIFLSWGNIFKRIAK